MGMPGLPPGFPLMMGMFGMPLGFPGAGSMAAALFKAAPNENIPAAFRKKAAEAAPAQSQAPPPACMPVGMPAGMPKLPGMPGMDPAMMMAMAAMMGLIGGLPPMPDPALAAAMMDPSAMMAALPAMPKPQKKQQQEEEDPNRPRTSFELAKDPDIVELFDHFQIDTRHLDRFCRFMEKRSETFEGDMLKIWELCEQARSPEGMLVSKIKEMEDGIFVGKIVPDVELTSLSKKYKFDKLVELKFSDVLAKYDKERRREYMDELDFYLATSARPSAMVMMFLKKLGTG